MTQSRGFRAIFLLLAFVAYPLVGAAALAEPELSYTVQVANESAATLRVSLRITNVGERATLVLRSVPSYMDNPVADAAGASLSKFRASGVSGKPLPVSRRKEKRGETSFVIQGPEQETLIEYEVAINFKESNQTRAYPIRIPFFKQGQGLLYGNYVFCYPDLGGSKQRMVGERVPIKVSFEFPEHLPLWGVPSKAELQTIYQLMSLQFGFGQFESEAVDGGLVDARVVYQKKSDFTEEERKVLREALSRGLSETIDFFGNVPFRQFAVLVYRGDGIGGMEGTFSCQVYAPSALDLADTSIARVRTFYSVLVHEIFHSWNPIALYAREDPWIKEGVTGYYGEVLSARSGLLEEGDLGSSFRYYESQLEKNPLFRTVRLTDPRLWENGYLNEDWRTLSYDRGKAVALLLDVQIREQTANSKSLDDVMRLLYERYEDGSYSHEELRAAVRHATGVDADSFFQTYVAGTKVASVKEIREANRKAKEFGVFQARVLHPVAASAARWVGSHRGRQTTGRVPAPGPVSIRSSPPRLLARSRIPASPSDSGASSASAGIPLPLSWISR
jgi:predicted metalloprotease with PDZ domain